MTTTLASLPQFLRYLSAFPPPDRVVDALARGPLRHLGARTAMVWRLHRDDVLRVVGAYGHSAEELERYGTVPMSLDLPITRAVRARDVLIDRAELVPTTYLAGIDAPVLEALYERTSALTSVSVPIVHADRAIGAFGFAADQAWDPDGPGPAVLDAVAGALAVWLTHPRAALEGVPTPPREWSLAFTPRQRELLALVESGLTNPAIAVALHVSESSVKADLARVMKALRTSDRREAASRARRLGLMAD